MSNPVAITMKNTTKRQILANLALFLVLAASLWPIAQGRILAQSSGPLSRILCSGQARTALTPEARESLERLASLTGNRDLLPAAQTPICPCQGCFTHGHAMVSVLPTPVLVPVRLARLYVYKQGMQARLRPSQSVARAHGARAPPSSPFFA
ncbi:MAG: hypothetical protein Q9M33_00550 [Robiginitomaculum sp.]|nr:hypothetical protein [Robiginitomaculum sp.]MDQ7078790.1 hypothetical protein [Robiginitomaculum sp.]